MPKWLFTILIFAKISVRRYFRDRVAIFFTVLFPLIFLIIFGSFSKNNDVNFHIGLINQSHSQFAQKFTSETKSSKIFKVDTTVTDLQQAQTKMSRGSIDATVVLPPDFGQVKNGLPSGQAVIYYDQNNVSAAQTLQSVLQGQFQPVYQYPGFIKNRLHGRRAYRIFYHRAGGLWSSQLLPGNEETGGFAPDSYHAYQVLAVLCIQRLIQLCYRFVFYSHYDRRSFLAVIQFQDCRQLS
jgi:hypothetical protein